MPHPIKCLRNVKIHRPDVKWGIAVKGLKYCVLLTVIGLLLSLLDESLTGLGLVPYIIQDASIKNHIRAFQVFSQKLVTEK